MTLPAASSARAQPKKPGPQATRHVYDVIVLGSQIAGVIAGALLAKRHHRVLLIDPEGLGAHYDDQGYELPYAPALLPPLKLMPQAESALAELGIAVELHRALGETPPELQLLFPNHRLDFGVDPEQRRAELVREFPADQARVLAALTAARAFTEETEPFFRTPLPFPPSGFFDRWALRKATRACPSLSQGGADLSELGDLPMAEALRSVAQFTGYLQGDGTPLSGPGARPLALALQGTHHFPNGLFGLREELIKRLTELGADCVGGPGAPAAVEELVFERRHLTGIRIAGNQNVFRAHYVISAMDVGALTPMISPKTKKHGLSEILESVRTRRFLFPINLVMREAGLPMGLKELAILVPGDEELGPVLLQNSPARRKGQEVPGERVLCAAAFVNGAEREAGATRMREIAARIEAAVLRLAPFGESHVVARSAPYLDAQNVSGSRLSPHPLLEMAGSPVLGVTGLAHRTRCKNLFLASREVLPGLGLEGEFMTGVRAAKLAQDGMKKHDPLK